MGENYRELIFHNQNGETKGNLSIKWELPSASLASKSRALITVTLSMIMGGWKKNNRTASIHERDE